MFTTWILNTEISEVNLSFYLYLVRCHSQCWYMYIVNGAPHSTFGMHLVFGKIHNWSNVPTHFELKIHLKMVNIFWMKDFQFNIIWNWNKQIHSDLLIIIIIDFIIMYIVHICNVHVYFPTVKFPFQWIASKQIIRNIH